MISSCSVLFFREGRREGVGGGGGAKVSPFRYARPQLVSGMIDVTHQREREREREMCVCARV